ncbi:hopanoid biosynthesis associated protein HpnK [Caballeronia terrestris]|uniref:Hopanoid biosynthesis associated protein HpnK n=1 Tax=Caballeronia terrestris TaxID=1226301 RepID=A0A158KKU7_9BURK|nr:hopanoid biosynthesis-associated protein HpnK [Caballeronia terrestris]SAL81615.1 hopanoid biosynthesis associated protein HpnK [Caballeronia terrestris]
MCGVIVTADDFGLHARVNEAVVLAHCDGVLSAASLMVGAPAAPGAIACARELPTLAVGLHLVLADGYSVLPHSAIPDLVDREGRFTSSMTFEGLRFFCLPHVRAQAAAEIRAQFEAYAATGLALDHVNTHKHFHLHPTVLALILDIGLDFGLRAMRLPNEMHGSIMLRPWIALAKGRIDRAGIDRNDYVAGLALTGKMDEAAFLDVLRRPPRGVLEIYCHPASVGTGSITPTMHGYRHADELAALRSPAVAAALASSGAMQGGFAAVFGHAARGEARMSA